MKNRISLLTLWICALFVALAFVQNSRGEDRTGALAAGESLKVAFVSDTQSPMFLETLRLSKNNNEQARAKIFDSILRFRPHSVFHLGDLVSLGFYGPSWDAIDAFLDRLRFLGIGFHPIPGNHELMLLRGSGEANFRKRFPDASMTGYLRRVGPLAVVLLNSNLDVLTVDERAKQLSWYKETLQKLDSDNTVGLVVVGCHHSPFTNSKIVDPSEDVQGVFVPPFLESAKARISFSGHAHAAEHFRIGEKDFLVIGGGGGLQHPLLTGSESRWPDLFPRRTEKRMFHYVEGVITGTSATFTVRMLNDEFTSFLDAWTVKYDFATIRTGGEGKESTSRQ